MRIKIGKLPGRINTIELNPGATIRDALSVANIELKSADEVRVNNSPVSPSQYASFVLSDEQTVLITAQVKGN